MSLLPYSVKVSCPYCGASLRVSTDRFEWRHQPVLVCCDSDDSSTCDKWFAVRVDVDVTLYTHMLEGE